MTGAPVTEPQAGNRREQRGWYFYDWATSAFNTTVITVFLGPYLIAIAESAQVNGFVDVIGLEVRPAAYFGLCITASVLLQLVLMPIVGAIADHTGRKREMLALFAYAGSIATMCLYFVEGDRYLLGGVLVVVAYVCFTMAMVVYNAFLPQIAAPDERDRVSSRGWGVGYLGGGLLLVLNLALFLNAEGLGVAEGDAVRISLVSAGLWWAVFTVIPLLALRNRRGAAAAGESASHAITGSLRQLGSTLAGLRKYPRTLLFLVAYLAYNDGIQTVISFSATYADRELGLDRTVQISAILMVQFVAFGGALLIGWLASRLGTKRVLLATIAVWTLVVASAYFVQKGVALQFYALGFAIAIVMGGSQAISRSLFSHLIPAGKEAEYFSLFEISDKGASFIGAAVLTTTLQVTGNYRVAIVTLTAFFIIGFVLLALVNLPRAIREADNPVPEHI